MIPAIDDARMQLERRFQLISGIARYGFNTAIMCSGKIYVPEIPPGARTRFAPADDVAPLIIGPKARKGSEDSGSAGAQEPDAPDLTPYTVIEALTTLMEYQRQGSR